MDMEWSERASPVELLRGDDLRTPDEVAAMLRLRSLGLGMKRIAAELGCSRNTVRRSIEAQGWVGVVPAATGSGTGRPGGVGGGAVLAAPRQRRESNRP
jgi:response regulator of citrate/malate metabolism